MGKQLEVRTTEIPGLFVVDLVLNVDDRGWFKESYQREKMEALNLPHFEIVQNNFSFNYESGATRGLHAEPWEKYISLANGQIFGAWIDLRAGTTFGKIVTMKLGPDTAVFVPRGVANGYQTLENNVTYTYLVNAHWSPDAKYASVNLFDPALNINWPIGKDQAVVSEKDLNNPLLADVQPMEF
jgi:dTDP-4-dehydrorhamnose 3,5-epimerase